MGRRLLLDTSVLIALERGKLAPGTIVADDDLCLSMIVVGEYLTGIALVPEKRRPKMQRFIDMLLDTVVVLPYDEEIVETHAKLLAWTVKQGTTRGQHDLIIAATAAVTQRELMTLDRKARFEEIPGVAVIYPDERGEV